MAADKPAAFSVTTKGGAAQPPAVPARTLYPIEMDLKATIRNIPDFPQEGVIFRDITTLLNNAPAFHELIDQMAEKTDALHPDAVLALDARGFLIGAPVAYALGLSLVPVRKAGKLPAAAYSVEYELEYGSGTFEMHKDALTDGERVVIIDDLLATGGSALAACQLAETAGAVVAGLGFVIDLTELGGRALLSGYPVFSLIDY